MAIKDTQSNLMRMDPVGERNLTWRRFDTMQLRASHPEYTNDSGGTLPDGTVIEMFRIRPAQLVLPISTVRWSALGAGVTLAVGWAEYEARGGVTVAADPDGLLTAQDASAAGGAAFDAVDPALFDGPAVLTVTIAGAVLPDAAVINMELLHGNVTGAFQTGT